MKNTTREFDKTHLPLDLAEERLIIHRDYLAHCLRWSHITKKAVKDHLDARWLDIGCGKDQPLARLLHTNKLSPRNGYYICCDLNKLETHKQFANASWKPTLMSNVDGTSSIVVDAAAKRVTINGQEFEAPTKVVCLEVLEHMAPKHCKRLVGVFAELAAAGATLYVSTPCYDAHTGAAGNHINELTYEALGSLFEDSGLEIQEVYGTFASQRDYLPFLKPEERLVFDSLRQYYDSATLSNIFAPLYPSKARNCIWVLGAKTGAERKFGPLADAAQPWTQSPDYLELNA